MNCVADLLSSINLHTNEDFLAIDIETTGLERSSEIVSASVVIKKDDKLVSQSFWIDRFHDQSKSDQLSFETLLDQTLFNRNYKGTVVFHNLDFDFRFLLDRFYKGKQLSFSKLPRLMDTLTISRIAKNNKFISHSDPRKLRCHSLKYLAQEFISEEHTSFEEVVDRANIRFAHRADILKYNEKDAELTLKLYDFFKTYLSNNEWSYIENIEMPHLLSLVQMNWYGVFYDVDQARNISDELSAYANNLEKDIFKTLGRTLNIQSHTELTSALFYNSKISYRSKNGDEIHVKPFFKTEQGRSKIDIDTLKTIQKQIQEHDPAALASIVIEKIIQFLEIKKSLTFIEGHLNLLQSSTTQNLHPNFSADAKSGRVKSSRPNLLGLPKTVFKKSDKQSLPPGIKELSVRHLVRAPQGYKVASIDISALDLAIVTYGANKFNKDFAWKEFFGAPHEIDIHLMIACRTNRDRFNKVFDCAEGVPEDFENYWVKKPHKTNGLTFINKKTNEELNCPFKVNRPDAFELVNRTRNLFKEVNLSTSYLMGAKNMAVNIHKKIGDSIGSDEAQDLLDRFYKAFPEVRQFQDHVCNLVYKQGYVESIFGRKFYADCFDELNEHHRSSNSFYELVWCDGNNYWYIKAETWVKFDDDVIEDLRIVKKPFGLLFKQIVICEKLNKNIFQRRKKKISKKFNRQSEANTDNLGAFELSRIGLSNEIDRALSLGTSLSSEANTLIDKFVFEGKFLIPEGGIILYRVPLPAPSSKYFCYYIGLLKVARKFFPLYCQGFANSLAMQVLTQIRETLERENIDARILLFIHDQVDVLVAEKDLLKVQTLLKASVESEKLPFDVKLSGKLEDASDHIN